MPPPRPHRICSAVGEARRLARSRRRATSCPSGVLRAHRPHGRPRSDGDRRHLRRCRLDERHPASRRRGQPAGRGARRRPGWIRRPSGRRRCRGGLTSPVTSPTRCPPQTPAGVREARSVASTSSAVAAAWASWTWTAGSGTAPSGCRGQWDAMSGGVTSLRQRPGRRRGRLGVAARGSAPSRATGGYGQRGRGRGASADRCRGGTGRRRPTAG